MSEARDEDQLPSGDFPELFLIEVPGDGGTRYFITETIITVDPQRSAMGIPWKDLAALFTGQTLRAAPVPGKVRWRALHRDRGSAA